jgi:hypothetical protein
MIHPILLRKNGERVVKYAEELVGFVCYEEKEKSYGDECGNREPFRKTPQEGCEA